MTIAVDETPKTTAARFIIKLTKCAAARPLKTTRNAELQKW
jgi:hypothetical protein